MGSRTLLIFILVIGTLALGIYMMTRTYVPTISTLPATVADSAGGLSTPRPGGAAGIEGARRDMKAMQEATRQAEQQSRPRQP